MLLLEAAGAIDLGEWILEPGGRISGFVLDQNGVGLEGARVGCLEDGVPWQERLADAATFEDLCRAAPEATSGVGGTFTLEGVPAGSRRLLAARSDAPPGISDLVDLRPDEHPVGVLIRIPAGRGYSVGGIVRRPDGEPLVGAQVHARSSRQRWTGSTDSQGRFRMLGTWSGGCEVLAVDPRGRWAEARWKGEVEDERTLDLVLRDVVPVEIRVVGSDLEPVEQFALRLVDAASGVSLSTIAPDPREGGKVDVAPPRCPFVIRVEAPGRMPYASPLLVEADVRAGWTCRMEALQGLRGKVLAEERPMAGVRVGLYEAFRSAARVNGLQARSSPVATSTTVSAANGEFVLAVPLPGSYFLRAEAQGWAPFESGPFDLAPHCSRVEQVHLGRGGRLEVLVRSAGGAPVSGRWVRITRGDAHGLGQRADAEGIARFEGLMPGAWQVDLADEPPPAEGTVVEELGGRPFEPRADCWVEHGGLTTTELWIEDLEGAGLLLVGYLIVDGSGASGWQARLQAVDGTEVGITDVHGDGGFELEAPQPGPYRLLVTRPPEPGSGPSVVLQTLSLQPPETSWSLSFETGRVDLELGPLEEDGRIPFHRWERGEVRIWTALLLDAGVAVAEGLPAGPGAIVLVDPDTALDRQDPQLLLEIDVPPGR